MEPISRTNKLHRAEEIIAALAKGVAILDSQHRIIWANTVFRSWCSEDPIHKQFLNALGEVLICSPEPNFQKLSPEITLSFRLIHQSSYIDIRIIPITHNNEETSEFIALCEDVTDLQIRQQKLNALHQAGHELADLDPGQLAEMTVDTRIELLKKNLKRHIHDLLQYNVIEIRLLNSQTQRLEPLLSEGMTSEAADRELFANIEGNGVTGYVAATGRSYLCTDTSNDPYYILGASNARCSMTVPIIYQDQVIGTFNVESPNPNSFKQEDLQFAELFSREIARALHTLNLLSAQQNCTITQSIDSINREIAAPADELMVLASTLIAQIRGKESDMMLKLQAILENARAIKHAIHKVGFSLGNRSIHLDPRGSLIKGYHILVIDSDEQVRRSAHAILEKYGCEVETVHFGKEGIFLAETGEFNAILCDIRHPDERGTIIYRSLRRIQPNARIILTQAFGYDSEHTVVNARQDGYWLPVIFKPFRVEQLLNALTCSPPIGKYTHSSECK